MGFRRTASYEVETADGNRWIVDSVHAFEARAMERAQILASGTDWDGVRVLEEKEGSKPKVIHQVSCRRKEKPVTIVPVEEAALCEDYEDLLTLPARRTIGRLMRNYLDREGLAPLELLFDRGRLRVLRHNETIWFQGLRHLAAVQARRSGDEARDRVTILDRLGEEAVERARDVPELAEPWAKLEAGAVADALEGLDPWEAAALGARLLGSSRDWKGKLDRLAVLLDGESDPDAVAWLDDLASEILDGAAAVRDLLGGQADLATALLAAAGVAMGRPLRQGDSPAARLAGAFARHRLPRARAALLAHVEMALGGVQPLTREGEATDRKAFHDLVRALAGPGGLQGGSGMAEAVVRRQRMVGGQGGEDQPPAEGLEAVLRILPTPGVRLGFLLSLAGAPFGGRNGPLVMQGLAKMLEGIGGPEDLLGPGASDETAAMLDDLRLHMDESPLPPDVKAWAGKRLADLATGRTAKPAPAPKTLAVDAEKPGLSQRTFPAGTLLFRQGDLGCEAYLVLSGEVAVFVSRDGRDVPLGTAGRSAIVGEMSLVDDAPRMASARALEDTVVRVIPRELFRRQLDRLQEGDPIMRRLVNLFVERLRTQADLPWYE
jgi:hypothetical protein